MRGDGRRKAKRIDVREEKKGRGGLWKGETQRGARRIALSKGVRVASAGKAGGEVPQP